MPVDQYFRYARSSFFRWADGGTVLVWDNGLTIAFRDELAAAINELADHVPPLNSIAMLFSACRDNWPQARLYLKMLGSDGGEYLNHWYPERTPEFIRDADWYLQQLDRIHEFSAEIRRDLRARCELARTIFDVSPNRLTWLNSIQAGELATQLSRGLPDDLESQGGIEQVLNPGAGDPESKTLIVMTSASQVVAPLAEFAQRDARQLLHDLSWLRAGIEDATPERLQRRLETGVADELKPADSREDGDGRALIESLLQDEELGGLARLARSVIPLVALPRQLSQPDDVVAGGVSDITNRGELDRLLLSELANDDLTLATRVALREALYLHRESPRAPRPQVRRVLLDTGLCLWGLPRLYATAVAMALNASAADGTHVKVVTPDGDDVIPVDLNDSPGVRRQLGRLTTTLNPAAALPRFLALEGEEEELVLVTEESVACDAEFLGELRAHLNGQHVFLVSVARSGALTMTQVSQRGRQEVRSGLLDLAEVLESSQKPTSREGLYSEDRLPEIFQQARFPLLASHQALPEKTFRSPAGPMSCTGDGRLLLWPAVDSGAMQLTDQLGKGRLKWAFGAEQGESTLVWGRNGSTALKLVHVSGGLEGFPQVTISHMVTSEPPVACGGFPDQPGFCFLELSDRWELFRTGHPNPSDVIRKQGDWNSVTHRGSHFSGSRFFRTSVRAGVRWWALAVVAGELQVTEVHLSRPDAVVTLFERPGAGIISVERDGTVTQLFGDAQTMKQANRHTLRGVASDGSEFVMGIGRESSVYSADTLTERPLLNYLDSEAMLSGASRCTTRSLRKKFTGIAAHGGDALLLRTHKGTTVKIGFRGGNLEMFETAQLQSEIEFVSFESSAVPEGACFSLSTAAWDCRSRAVLDSRGLLHLCSHEAHVPQVSLVLTEVRMAGWSPVHGAFGPAYWLPGGRTQDGHRDRLVFESSVREFIRCLTH